MQSPRIIIADDSIVVRMILNRLLTADLQAEVVMAANGEIVLDKAAAMLPDLVILDVEMPRMNGLDTLRTLRKLHPRLPIIMLSAVTEVDAGITIEALALGASDFLSKEGHFKTGDVPIAYLRKELIPKITGLLESNYYGKSAFLTDPLSPEYPAQHYGTLFRNPKALHTISILAVAVSTGGPLTLERILSALPATLNIPIVIVQHIPAEFSAQLALSLGKKCSIKIFHCQDGMELEKGCAYIAQGGQHMEVRKELNRFYLKTHSGPPENSCRPSGDVLFRSVAKTFGSNVLALVLTGMGQDGLKGCETIKGAGGYVLVQDEASSVVWGMPGAVFRAGLADEILPLEKIASRILTLLG